MLVGSASINTSLEHHMAAILARILPQDNLRTITVEIDDTYRSPWEWFLHELSQNKIDKLLNGFTKLTSLRFHVHEVPQSRWSADWWHTNLCGHLPQLGRAVTISVTTSKHSPYSFASAANALTTTMRGCPQKYHGKSGTAFHAKKGLGYNSHRPYEWQ